MGRGAHDDGTRDVLVPGPTGAGGSGECGGASNTFGGAFRDYGADATARQQQVAAFYKEQHARQTVAFGESMREKFLKLDTCRMDVWTAAELLNEIVDDSDPDTDLAQIAHGLQSAEAARAAYPEHDWLHLTAFVHDLGKVLAHPSFGSQPQWAVVGDTFPVGCKHDDAVIFHEFFRHNPDAGDPRYSTRDGIYAAGIGLDAVRMSWGHDEYLYQVLKRNGCTLPPPALFIIRYHSFYALHRERAYMHLLDDSDRECLPWLDAFNRFDLYTKSSEAPDVEALKPYYVGLIDKYCPGVYSW